MEDTEILKLFTERNEQAIEAAQERYGGRLKGLALSILGNREDAEECVNDTLWKAWSAIPPAKPRLLFSYLAKICRNASLDRLNYRNAQMRRGTVLELTSEIEQCIPDKWAQIRAESGELAEILNRFLKGLPAEKRILFVRRYWYGDTISELARSRGISEAKAKTTLFRLRKQLKEYLEKEEIVI